MTTFSPAFSGVVEMKPLPFDATKLDGLSESLGGNGHPDSAVRAALADAFGAYDTWETEFRRIGQGLGGGSGWVVLGYNAQSNQVENYWLWDQLHGPPATWPLLVTDMYEHSYPMDFAAAAATYIDAFFRNIQWETVLDRLEAGTRPARAGR